MKQWLIATIHKYFLIMKNINKEYFTLRKTSFYIQQDNAHEVLNFLTKQIAYWVCMQPLFKLFVQTASDSRYWFWHKLMFKFMQRFCICDGAKRVCKFRNLIRLAGLANVPLSMMFFLFCLGIRVDNFEIFLFPEFWC